MIKLHRYKINETHLYVWNNQALDNFTFQEIKQRLFGNVNQELVM